MPRQVSSKASPEPTRLTRSRQEAERLLVTQITKGQEIAGQLINTRDDLKKADADYQQWSALNAQLLKQLFTTDEQHRSYAGIGGGFIGGGRPTLAAEIEDFREKVQEKVQRLKNIEGQLNVIPEPADGSISAIRAESSSNHRAATVSNKVFVVHGHDQLARASVDAFLRKVKLEPVILSEQAPVGMTIFEALEHYGDCQFAVVLFTPDDVGGTRDMPPDHFKPRARQNVVLEYGYFAARLGRPNVCALVKTDVERPSDMDGLLYIAMDEQDGWQLRLARAMSQQGLPVDGAALLGG